MGSPSESDRRLTWLSQGAKNDRLRDEGDYEQDHDRNDMLESDRFFQQPISMPEYAAPGEEEVDLFALLEREPHLMDLLNTHWGQSVGPE